MNKRLVAFMLIAALSLLLLAGCWDRKELTELGIVVALGFDRENESGKILLTSQVVRPGSLKKQKDGGGEAPYEIVISSGNTVIEAMRNTIKEFDRKSFFSHVKVIVVSEAIARDSMNEIMDFISRSHEIRKFTWLVVARGHEASKVLSVKHGIENVQATYMEGIIKRQSENSEVTSTNIIDFLRKMPGEGINPVTGVFDVINVESIADNGKKSEETEGLSLAGTAVYKKDKLVGFLSNDETRALNCIQAKIHSGVISVPSPANRQKNISIEIKRVESNIKPRLSQGIISFEVNIDLEGNITGVEGLIDVSKPEEIEKISNEFSKYMQNNINTSVNKIQRELRTDILGFGSAFEDKFPREWKSIKDRWDDIFPEVAYSVNVNGRIKLTGLLLKPLNVKKQDK